MVKINITNTRGMRNVTISGGTITVNGQTITGEGSVSVEESIPVILSIPDEAHIGRLEIRGNTHVTVEGGLGGDLVSDGSVTSGDVGGAVQAGGSVRCDDVRGSVMAGGSVRCGSVDGGVQAGGSVNMGR